MCVGTGARIDFSVWCSTKIFLIVLLPVDFKMNQIFCCAHARHRSHFTHFPVAARCVSVSVYVRDTHEHTHSYTHTVKPFSMAASHLFAGLLVVVRAANKHNRRTVCPLLSVSLRVCMCGCACVSVTSQKDCNKEETVTQKKKKEK